MTSQLPTRANTRQNLRKLKVKFENAIEVIKLMDDHGYSQYENIAQGMAILVVLMDQAIKITETLYESI